MIVLQSHLVQWLPLVNVVAVVVVVVVAAAAAAAAQISL